MIKKYPYWVYVAGVFVAWAIVLVLTRPLLSRSRFDNALIFGCGFSLGVLAATLARRFFK